MPGSALQYASLGESICFSIYLYLADSPVSGRRIQIERVSAQFEPAGDHCSVLAEIAVSCSVIFPDVCLELAGAG